MNQPLHTEILSNSQLELIKLVESFKNDYYLVGGTALALQIGHRRSIDFDLFSNEEISTSEILKQVKSVAEIERVLVDSTIELTIMVNGVKLTWYAFGFKLLPAVDVDFCRMPDPATIGAMKLYALGRRAKWKDYVDLYFLLKEFDFTKLATKAEEIFGTAFEEKLARIQLSYFEDINYQEQIDFMPGFSVEDEEVKKYLTSIAVA